ncbi:hypothetical protein NUW58_g8596 [Xylaria curta]|uniref:Uncharacterized protein n=1 Tax=Xylaria curta TaxID=42375 RepID=A0ACC1N863_9PEZI|nr:hypothetical protein NUW58_g8596 [Xylaria curta]
MVRAAPRAMAVAGIDVSAAVLPRGARHRRGSGSPPPISPSEDVPESPRVPPLPNNDITTPRDRDGGIARYQAHRHKLSTNTDNTENTMAFSVASSQKMPTVMEAVTQTMVGEWMFKYVRRRKSFGVAEGGGREENSNDRHKRWVWLAPYDRSILWSSKQPVTSNALQGKSGRKLTVQSVLDVKDDNPVPKGETQIFNRSILVLTPQRALKFTAVSADRHYAWLMALSFLSHGQQEMLPEVTVALAPPKAVPPPDPELSRPKTKRGAIRDSIRLTKGKNPSFMSRHDQTAQPSLQEEPEPVPIFPAHIGTGEVAPLPNHQRDLSTDAAEPPLIPRFNRVQGRVYERANQVVLHGRKRSNTGGHVPPPLSFRGFSPPGSSMHASSNSTAGASIDTVGSSDIYGQSQVSSNLTSGMSTVGSQRTSEASSRPAGSFFEPIGTVRMEAFISPLSKFDDHPMEEPRYSARRQSKERRRRGTGLLTDIFANTPPLLIKYLGTRGDQIGLRQASKTPLGTWSPE